MKLRRRTYVTGFVLLLAVGSCQPSSNAVEGPKVLKLAVIRNMAPEDVRTTAGGTEVRYDYLFDRPINEVVAEVQADPLLSGWTKKDMRKVVLFNNPSDAKNSVAISSEGPSKCGMTIYERK